jgi:precorrin-2 dehydrogenase/sirohydrochlorin ferrochelatase
MIPLYHDFTDESVAVFGGGPVGARKARRFTREATVVVVSPEFPADDYGGAALIRAAPDESAVVGWIDRVDPTLVVAATSDPGINEAIEHAARERGALVNRTDCAGARESDSVVVPATVRDGPVVVSISTGARSPALARELRKRIESEIDGAGELATVTAEVREELKDRGVDPDRRRQAIRTAIQSSEVWKDLGRGGSKLQQTVDAVVDAALGDKP